MLTRNEGVRGEKKRENENVQKRKNMTLSDSIKIWKIMR